MKLRQDHRDVLARPFFMFGFDRSGTTLLSMMVGAHPELAVPFSAAGMWFRYARKLGKYNDLSTWADIRRVVDDLLQEERINLWSAPLDRHEILDGVAEGNFSSVFSQFHMVYARIQRKPLWGNIDIATMDNMDIVYDWFPKARFIHIVRDGRDVALSHEKYRYGLSNTLECAMEWRRRVGANLKMGAMLSPEQYLLVRYEDLVLNSEIVLREISQFLGVRYAPEMLEYPESVKQRVPKEKKWLWPTLDQRPVISNAYRWKNAMSLAKRAIFEWNAGDLLDQLGYETFDEPPKRLDAYILELWQFLGRGGRFTRLARRVTPKFD